MNDLVFLPLAVLQARMRAGDLTPAALTDACLDRIEHLQPTTHAFIAVDPDGARTAARDADPALPLGGIPWACKDLFDANRMATTAGSAATERTPATTDARAVAQLRTAGAVLLGKTNLHEFAFGATGENAVFGTVPNPWDRSRLAGGSSSGSVAAVAHGMAGFALATDTGGSVRAPAALSGVVGFKPGFGRIDLDGAIPFSWSLDHAGIVARTVADLALVWPVFAGHGEAPPADDRASIQGLRIGLPRGFFFADGDAEIIAATETMARGLETAGAILRDVKLPDLSLSRAVSLAIQLPEALAFHGPMLERRPEGYSAELRAGLASGQFLLAEHYINARRMAEAWRREVDALFGEVDLLLTPTCPIVAPRPGEAFVEVGGESLPVGNAITRNTSFFNLTGHPAISLPSGRHSLGLPMGVQLVAGRDREDLLLKGAMACEAIAPPFSPPPDPC